MNRKQKRANSRPHPIIGWSVELEALGAWVSVSLHPEFNHFNEASASFCLKVLTGIVLQDGVDNGWWADGFSSPMPTPEGVRPVWRRRSVMGRSTLFGSVQNDRGGMVGLSGDMTMCRSLLGAAWNQLGDDIHPGIGMSGGRYTEVEFLSPGLGES